MSSTPCAPVNPTSPSTSTQSPRFHAPSLQVCSHARDCPLNRLPHGPLPWLVSAFFSEYTPITDSASSCSSPPFLPPRLLPCFVTFLYMLRRWASLRTSGFACQRRPPGQNCHHLIPLRLMTVPRHLFAIVPQKYYRPRKRS